jgi:hypothetical protein
MFPQWVVFAYCSGKKPRGISDEDYRSVLLIPEGKDGSCNVRRKGNY